MHSIQWSNHPTETEIYNFKKSFYSTTVICNKIDDMMVISKLVRPPPFLSQCKIPSISLRNVDIFQYTLGGYILRAGGNLRLKTLKSNIFIKFGYDVSLKRIILLAKICCSPTFLLSKKGSYVIQLLKLFVLQVLTWRRYYKI